MQPQSAAPSNTAGPSSLKQEILPQSSASTNSPKTITPSALNSTQVAGASSTSTSALGQAQKTMSTAETPNLQPGPSRREEELARKDRTLTEFMTMLDDYEPLIPEEITQYFLQKAGFESADPRLTRLFSLTTQKLLSDISTDAYHYARIRTNAQPGGRGRPAGAAQQQKDKNRTVLTMDDLSASLAERGVHLKKPDYFQ
ncbi:Transcription initiation factor TFIID, subunit TAF10 (also component of histone acetyltransferase SAGA) [Phaffia rhodozyma]|uniref:Transcription initiation factor TFIID subunit 10 n=1 Tax=Phaffia rhodozyma TaxID=264483 RepID=A0A0F7SV20_PHARH|nr:Transcription initiation factor TFIID, subunit TAF10 (also component of histone acetyltransferase SAGA) [Phaffia rhodozyma]